MGSAYRIFPSFAIFTVAVTFSLGSWAGEPVATPSQDYDLRLSTSQLLRHVELKLEAAGKLSVVENGTQRAPLAMTLRSEQAYLERRLTPGPGQPKAIRHYERAAAQIEVGSLKSEPKLADAHRLIVVTDEPSRPFRSAAGPLTSDEAELLDVPGGPAVLDGLLPSKPVKLDETWTHADDLAAELLGLDAVSSSSLKSTLREVRGGLARIELAGIVHGADTGVAAEIDVKARYTVSIERRVVTWAGMVIKEKRTVGPVAPGVDATSRLTLTITTSAAAPALSDEAVAAALTLVSKPQPLAYRNLGRFQLHYDRQWYEIADQERVLVLRLVDRGELLAQCNVATLDQAKPDKRPSLSSFEADVRKVLGESFEQLVSADELPHTAGYSVFRVIAAGKTAELPIHWHYFLLLDATGRQAAIVFTIEDKNLERFGSADQRLVSAFRFAPAPATASVKATERR